jgi:hypothetical protein
MIPTMIYILCDHKYDLLSSSGTALIIVCNPTGSSHVLPCISHVNIIDTQTQNSFELAQDNKQQLTRVMGLINSFVSAVFNCTYSRRKRGL